MQNNGTTSADFPRAFPHIIDALYFTLLFFQQVSVFNFKLHFLLLPVTVPVVQLSSDFCPSWIEVLKYECKSASAEKKKIINTKEENNKKATVLHNNQYFIEVI